MPKPLLQCVVEEYDVNKSQVAEFQSLLGLESDYPLSDATLFVLPHVWTQAPAMTILTHADFPISLIGSVHLKSVFRLHDREALRDLLTRATASVRIAATYLGAAASPNGKGVEVFLLLELHHSDRVLWSEIMVIFKATNAKNPTKGIHPSHLLDSDALQATAAEISNMDFTSYPPPHEGTALRVPVSSADTWRFGVSSGDVNPIHMFTLGAKLFGLPRRIAHGMLVVGKALVAQPQVIESVQSWCVTFKAPVLCDSFITVVANPGGADLLVLDPKSQLVKQPGRPNICIRSVSPNSPINNSASAASSSHL